MSPQPIKVLMIEDDPEEFLFVQETLSQDKIFPFDLEHVNRLKSGLKRLEQGGIDLVLLDLNLPDSLGLNTFLSVHTHAPQVAIVILTDSYKDEQLALTAIQKGAQDHLEKSEVRSKILSRTIQYAIERKKMERQLHQAYDDLEKRVQERTEELTQANNILEIEIKGRQLAQQTLSHKEKWFRTLIENSADILTLVDAQGVIIYSSPSTKRILGYPLHEYVGRKIFDFVHPEDLELITKYFRELCAKHGNFLSVECRYLKKDGSWCWMEGSGNNLLMEENIHSIVINVRDITLRKDAEEERSRLAAIVDSSNDSIIAKTLEGIIISWNRAAERLYGYKAAEVISQSISILVPPDRPLEIQEILNRLKQGEKIEELETVRVRKDGQHINVALTISPIKNGSGKIIGASSIARDITERRRAQRQIEEASRLKSEFTSTVSHELRTPLAISKEALSLILRGKVGDVAEKQKEILILANANLDRLAFLINDVLDFAKMEAGKLEVHKELIDIIPILQESYDGWKLKADSQKIDLRLTAPDKPIILLVDKIKFLQILANLLNNALKFTPEGGRINLRVEDMPAVVKFSVMDTGPGIAQEDIQKLFQKFQQLKRTPGPGYQGTGLGLNIAESLIKIHGGTIHVESELGKGSQFVFTLPKTQK